MSIVKGQGGVIITSVITYSKTIRLGRLGFAEFGPPQGENRTGNFRRFLALACWKRKGEFEK